jgi:outer membrane protein
MIGVKIKSLARCTCALGFMLSLTFAPALLYAQTGELNASLHLKLSHNLLATVPVALEAAQTSAQSINYAGVTRFLKQPQQCGASAVNRAVGVLRMAEVVNHVICHRLGVQEGFGLTEQALAALELAQGQRQPVLNLSAGVDAVRGSNVSSTVALRLDWLLFDFGASNAGIQQSRLALAAVLDDQRAEVLLALADASQLFAAAKTAFGRLDSATVNLRTAQSSAQMTEARQAAGAGSLSEKVQAQTSLAQARLELVRSQSQWLSTSGALSVAMGLGATYAIAFDPTEGDDDSYFDQAIDVKALVEEARSRHPKVTAARARLTEVQTRVKSIDAERWGNISLSAIAGRIRTNGYTDLRDTSSASVLWTLPLLDRGVTTSRMRDVQGQIQIRSAGVDDALNQIELQVWQQSQALISDRDILREARAVRNSAELSLRVSSERYRSGVGLFSDVLSSQNVAANARFQWVESRSNLLKSQLRLAASIGRFGPLAPN